MRLLRGVGLGLLVALVAVVLGPAAAAESGDDVVTVAQGTLRGSVKLDHREFLNLPFAAPPVGVLRFRPPEPAASWSGTRDATKAGNVCPQAAPLGNVSEDCLQLNVYTPPAAESHDLPVMVWLPGGAYILGAANGYDPTPLVKQGRVIVVTVNYRLGPFGFLALPGLATESGTTGNYGLLDQQAALRWVRANIGAFGGNPSNVTLFGESAGGHSVCMQVISPTAAGLFDKAISESGGCVDTALGPIRTATAYANGEKAAAAVGCADPDAVVACLRGKSMNDLLTQQGSFDQELTWVPSIDGKVLSEPTAQALDSGRYNHVPLISGTNKDEGRLFLGVFTHLSKFRRATAAELQQEIAFRNGGTATPALVAAYPPQASDNADVAFAQVTTDGAFACPGVFFARGAAAQPGQAIFSYEFADPNPPYSGLDPLLNWGDFHGSEVLYLFGSLQGIPALLNEDQKRLSQQMIGYWTTFAKTGNPNGSGLPSWPAFTTSSPQAQRLTSTGTTPVTSLATDHNCALWER